jgi:hypothetical protein
MIFAAIKAGEYVILENDIVVARITRHKFIIRSPRAANTFWSRSYYRVAWRDTHLLGDYYKEFEEFKTLADIQDKYQFENYAGYGKVLKRR